MHGWKSGNEGADRNHAPNSRNVRNSPRAFTKSANVIRPALSNAKRPGPRAFNCVFPLCRMIQSP